MSFITDYSEILALIDKADPPEYARSRNYLDGAVTRLSPYISRGVISTKQVLQRTLERGYEPGRMEKFTQELAWRDHWQQNWIAKGTAINKDLKHEQFPVENKEIASHLVDANLGIEAIDAAVKELYETGYMHNHVRMYTAAIACNMAYSHWWMPARWMYYHLLDADWASNALSWQWVAGSNANKKYVANQGNVNKYCHTNDHGTFMDVDYSAFEFPTNDHPEWKAHHFKTPEKLKDTVSLELVTKLPESQPIILDSKLPSYIYNWYNLDPKWDEETVANRILLLEPSVFKEYPISDKSVQFMLDLSKNIAGIQVFVGEFSDLISEHSLTDIHFKEHPLNTAYKGTEHSRDWMFSVSGYHSSFFGFWKKAKKQFRY
ncbi:MAG: FAD-binding domain-containing protein [Flavobacteriales bacterium]